MKLIAGLGNPGAKYSLTRHNIGFLILDYIAYKNNLVFKPGKGDWYECKLRNNDEDIYLIKPSTYMNNSGIAVKKFLDDHEGEIGAKDVLVIVDDFQIKSGSIRVRKKGSDGGHNGLASIIYHLNSDEFPRLRAGIGSNDALKKEEFIDFVLGNFDEDELQTIKKMMPVYYECIFTFINHGITKTMNEFNRTFENNKPEKIKPSNSDNSDKELK